MIFWMQIGTHLTDYLINIWDPKRFATTFSSIFFKSLKCQVNNLEGYYWTRILLFIGQIWKMY